MSVEWHSRDVHHSDEGDSDDAVIAFVAAADAELASAAVDCPIRVSVHVGPCNKDDNENDVKMEKIIICEDLI